jgi:hypothetical protein
MVLETPLAAPLSRQATTWALTGLRLKNCGGLDKLVEVYRTLSEHHTKVSFRVSQEDRPTNPSSRQLKQKPVSA